MNKLKVKTVVLCNICGCRLRRVKTFSVSVSSEEEAKQQVSGDVFEWVSSLRGSTCRVCRSILESVG